MFGLVRQMSVAGGGEDGMMAEELLHLDQIDPGLDQVSRVRVAIMPSSALSPLCRVPDYAEFGPPPYQGQSVGVG
jgi:hypothetical protein